MEIKKKKNTFCLKNYFIKLYFFIKKSNIDNIINIKI